MREHLPDAATHHPNCECSECDDYHAVHDEMDQLDAAEREANKGKPL